MYTNIVLLFSEIPLLTDPKKIASSLLTCFWGSPKVATCLSWWDQLVNPPLTTSVHLITVLLSFSSACCPPRFHWMQQYWSKPPTQPCPFFSKVWSTPGYYLIFNQLYCRLMINRGEPLHKSESFKTFPETFFFLEPTGHTHSPGSHMDPSSSLATQHNPAIEGESSFWSQWVVLKRDLSSLPRN